jgi:hypothetical protein
MQGGSVVRALANDSKYQVSHDHVTILTTPQIRALTRDPSKEKAKKLLELGSNITLQECDITSESSLAAALKDCYGFFAMTNYFEHRLEKEEDSSEVKDGKQMADVAKEVGITHYLWSTFPEYKKLSKGKWSHVALFDNKDEIKKHVETLAFPITSFVAPSGFYQNQMGPGNPSLVLRRHAKRC